MDMEYVAKLRKNRNRAKQNLNYGLNRTFWSVLGSIVGAILSVVCMHGAAAERHMTIEEMLAKHIYGGEWLVIIATICCAIYALMMIWDCAILYRTYRIKNSRYVKYRKALHAVSTDTQYDDEKLFNLNEVEVC